VDSIVVPLAGLDLLKALGSVSTAKEAVLIALPPELVTVILPVAAPTGTVAVIEVGETIEKLALTPLKRTAVTRAKLMPEIVTFVPIGPLIGEKLVMTGGTALTAESALTIPAPQREVVQSPPLKNGLAVLWRIWSTCDGVRFGLSDNINETTPLTCGAAMLVPL
jgi:hypothetical protein